MYGRTFFKRINNREVSTVLEKDQNGDIWDGETFVTNINNPDYEDELDDYEEGWKEVNWSQKDWGDYYGVDEDEVEDAMDDDLGWFDND